jgi:hypothetical protein
MTPADWSALLAFFAPIASAVVGVVVAYQLIESL